MKKEDFLKVCRSKATKPLTAEDESFLSTVGEAIETAFTEDTANRNKALNEELEKIVGKFDGNESVAAVVRKLAQQIDEMKQKAERGLSSSDVFKLRAALEKNKDVIRNARKNGGDWAIEFKAKRAASTMMTSSSVMTSTFAPTSENWIEDTEILVIQYPKNFILDAITSRQVSKVPETLVQKEQITAGEGEITVVSEGSTKPIVDYKFTKKTYDRKKYAGRIEFTEEMEMDFEQLLNKIIMMFEEDVIRAWNDGVLADILTYASTYVSTIQDGTLVDPDIFAVIGAGINHIQDNNYEPDILCMNPGDIWRMRLTQDKDGNYKVNPLQGGYAGLVVYPSNKITSGKMLIGTQRTIKEQHSPYIIRRGQYGEQLIDNEYTIVGEVFSLLQTPTISKASWLYLDINTVMDALELVKA